MPNWQRLARQPHGRSDELLQGFWSFLQVCCVFSETRIFISRAATYAIVNVVTAVLGLRR